MEKYFTKLFVYFKLSLDIILRIFSNVKNKLVSVLIRKGEKVQQRRNASALPCFLVMGQAKAGKSTLIKSYKAVFRVESENSAEMKTVEEKRKFEWTKYEKAIFIEASEDIISKENNLMGFELAKFLKKNGKNYTFGGAIIVLDTKKFLSLTTENIIEKAGLVRRCTEQVCAELKCVFPIYFVFTRSDLIDGFETLCSKSEWEENIGFWEACFNKENYEEQIELMYSKLRSFSLFKILKEKENNAKEIVLFLYLFKNIISKWKVFFAALFKEGEDRFLYGLYSACFLSFSKNTNNSWVGCNEYLIKNFFDQILYNGNRFLGKAEDQKKLLLKRYVVGFYVLFIGSFLVFSSIALIENIALVNKGEALVNKVFRVFLSQQADLNSKTAALLNIYNYYYLLNHYNHYLPWYFRLGLYRGNSQEQLIKKILFHELYQVFLLPICGDIEVRLNNYADLWKNKNLAERETFRGDYYNLLKTYLMLSFPARIRVNEITPNLYFLWSQLLSRSVNNYMYPEDQLINFSVYRPLLNFYIMSLSQGDVKTMCCHPAVTIVNQARYQLRSSSLVENLYSQIISQSKLVLPYFSLHDVVSNNYENILYSHYFIPGAFTKIGWETYIKKAINEATDSHRVMDWVIVTPLSQLDLKQLSSPRYIINRNINENQLRHAIENLYFSDYTKYWFAFINSIRVSPFASLSDAANRMAVLSDINGPISQVAKAIFDNLINVYELKPTFDTLRYLLFSEQNGSVSQEIKKYLSMLSEIKNDFQRLADSQSSYSDAESYASHLLAGQAENSGLIRAYQIINTIINQENNVMAQKALQSLLMQPLFAAWQTLLDVVGQEIQYQWQRQVLAPYQEILKDKFPFDHYSENDAAMDEVSRFFSFQAGYFWIFINTYLEPYLYHDNAGWHVRTWLNQGLAFSDNFFTAVNQADDLSHAIENKPHFSFSLLMVPVTGISQLIFAINGTTYRYRNEPSEWQEVQGSSDMMDQEAELTAIAAKGESPRTLRQTGNWAFWRLLRLGTIVPLGKSVYRIVWSLSGGKKRYSVNLLLRVEGNEDWMQALLLKGFNLPSKIFSDLP